MLFETNEIKYFFERKSLCILGMELFIPLSAKIIECVDNQSANNTYKIWRNLTYGPEKSKWISGFVF
jgi:hypothetical protein